jgi:hypothetical protein
LYKKLLHKSEFGQAHCVEWFKSIHPKKIYNFLTFLQVSTNFGICTISWELNQLKNDLKSTHSARANPARGYSARLGGLPRSADRPAGWATAWQPGPAAEAARSAASPRAATNKVSQKRRCEHREGVGDAPDEVVVARAHPSSDSTCGGGVEEAQRCPTVAEALRSRRRRWLGPAAPEERGEGEAHATCKP